MKEEIVEVPKWFLENVENTLRIQNNINLDKKTGETCQDRNVKESLNGLRKLLSGEELTGMERLEKLHPELLQEQPQGLDEAAEKDTLAERINEESKRFPEVSFAKLTRIAKHFYDFGKEAGTKWMAEQGFTVDAVVDVNAFGQGYFFPCNDIPDMHYGDKVIVQIRKKEE